MSGAGTLWPGAWAGVLLPSTPVPGEGSTGSPTGSCCRVLQGPLFLPSPFQTVTNFAVTLVKAWLRQGMLVGLAGFHTHSLSFKSAREIPAVLKTHICSFPPLPFLFFTFLGLWKPRSLLDPFPFLLSPFSSLLQLHPMMIAGMTPWGDPGRLWH